MTPLTTARAVCPHDCPDTGLEPTLIGQLAVGSATVKPSTIRLHDPLQRRRGGGATFFDHYLEIQRIGDS